MQISENSFYYFFSATPQVLGGVLALFGVLVIYKIQILADLLRKKADIIQQNATTWFPPEADKETRKITMEVRSKIIEGMESSNFKKILVALDLNDNNGIIQDGIFVKEAVKFRVYEEYRSDIIKRTILYSKFTAAIIVFCLGVLPCGTWLTNCPAILVIFFIIVVSGACYTFWKLISLFELIFLN